MQGIQGLNPLSPTFLRDEAVLSLAKAYDSDFENLKRVASGKENVGGGWGDN